MQWKRVLSVKSSLLKPERAFEFLALAREAREKGIDVISFGIGQPDVPPPDCVLESFKKAIEDKKTGYSPTPGLLELREVIADYVNENYKCDAKTEDVIVTVGAKSAIFMSLMALINDREEVLIPDPSYPVYESAVSYLGGVVKFYRLLESPDGWKLDFDDLLSKISEKTKVIILNNPHNPTGAAFSRKEVLELCRIASEKNIVIIADEVYEKFVFDEVHTSTLEHEDWRDFLVYVNGFSKTFSMTGMRLGYVVTNKELIERLSLIANNIYSCPPTPAQIAAITALKEGLDSISGIVNEYMERRNLIVNELRRIPGVNISPPKGAFYAFPDISDSMRISKYSDVEKFVYDILFEAGVLVLPGTAFPGSTGNTHVRLSFATNKENIREGMARLRRWIYEKGGL